MNRREFLVKSAVAGAGIAASRLALPEALANRPKSMPVGQRRNYVWGGIDRKMDESALNYKYRQLKLRGIDGIFLSGGIDDREFNVVRECGLELHTWMWTTNRGDQWIRDHHPDWYMVSRSGKSCFDKPPYVDYYRWVSPVIPGVQRYLEDEAGKLAAHPAVSGVHLDYVRYPDVILPRALWKQYNLDQTEELPDYDFCYSKHTREAFKKVSGRDPLEIEHPDRDQEWLHFRHESVTRLVQKLTKVVHSEGKKITAAVFPTPSQARKICRQDWDKWPLDFACPMIYHSFYNEGVDWIGDCMRENVEAATFPIHAGLYMPAFKDPEEFRTALKLVRHRGGAGVSLFGGVDPAFWKAFEEELP